MTLGTVWDFLQKEVLGMNWLNRAIGSLLNACGLDTTTRIGGSVQFFIYDVIKIFVLLGVLILIISYIQSYFPPERTKKILGRFHGIGANCVAALLGTVTPFCSCSSIPLFIGFTSAGLPLGVTFSFLISSPMVDLGSLVLLMSIFGWKVAVIYVLMGLVIAVIGGTLIEKMHLENQVEEYIQKGRQIDVPQEELHFSDRIKYAWEQVVFTAKKVAPYVLIGVGIGAFIHNWIPEDFIVKVLGDNNPFGVILATIAGVPMYADIFGTIPIAEALLAKGALLGVVLSFMMGVTTLSLPSIIMLSSSVSAFQNEQERFQCVVLINNPFCPFYVVPINMLCLVFYFDRHNRSSVFLKCNISWFLGSCISGGFEVLNAGNLYPIGMIDSIEASCCHTFSEFRIRNTCKELK